MHPVLAQPEVGGSTFSAYRPRTLPGGLYRQTYRGRPPQEAMPQPSWVVLFQTCVSEGRGVRNEVAAATACTQITLMSLGFASKQYATVCLQQAVFCMLAGVAHAHRWNVSARKLSQRPSPFNIVFPRSKHWYLLAERSVPRQMCQRSCRS